MLGFSYFGVFHFVLGSNTKNCSDMKEINKRWLSHQKQTGNQKDKTNILLFQEQGKKEKEIKKRDTGKYTSILEINWAYLQKQQKKVSPILGTGWTSEERAVPLRRVHTALSCCGVVI